MNQDNFIKIKNKIESLKLIFTKKLSDSVNTINTKGKTAWSLLETSITLIVISTVLIAAMAYSVNSFKNDLETEIQKKRHTINLAIEAYVLKNGRYPCPASLYSSNISGSLNYGKEVGGGTGCADVTAVGKNGVLINKRLKAVSFTVPNDGNFNSAYFTAISNAGYVNQVIEAIAFASYGTPPAGSSSPNLEYVDINPNCHAQASKLVLAERCIGHNGCSGVLRANDSTFFVSRGQSVPGTCGASSNHILKVTLLVSDKSDYISGASGNLIGQVPFAELGLTSEDVIDSSGNKLLYVVHRGDTISLGSGSDTGLSIISVNDNCNRASTFRANYAIIPCDNRMGGCFDDAGNPSPLTNYSAGTNNPVILDNSAIFPKVANEATIYDYSGTDILKCVSSNPNSSSNEIFSNNCNFDGSASYEGLKDITYGYSGSIACKDGYDGSVQYSCTSPGNITSSLIVNCTQLGLSSITADKTSGGSLVSSDTVGGMSGSNGKKTCWFGEGVGYYSSYGIPANTKWDDLPSVNRIKCSKPNYNSSVDVKYYCGADGGDITKEVALNTNCPLISTSPSTCSYPASSGCYNSLSGITAGSQGSSACTSSGGSVNYTCPTYGGTIIPSNTCCTPTTEIGCNITETDRYDSIPYIPADAAGSTGSMGCKNGYSSSVFYTCGSSLISGTSVPVLTIYDTCVPNSGRCSFLSSAVGHYNGKTGILPSSSDYVDNSLCMTGYSSSVTYRCSTPPMDNISVISNCSSSTTSCNILADTSSPPFYNSQSNLTQLSGTFACASPYIGSVLYSCSANCSCEVNTTNCFDCSVNPQSCKTTSPTKSTPPLSPLQSISKCINTDPNYFPTNDPSYSKMLTGEVQHIVSVNTKLTKNSPCPLSINIFEQKVCQPDGTFITSNQCNACLANYNPSTISMNLARSNLIIPEAQNSVSNLLYSFTKNIACDGSSEIWGTGSISLTCSNFDDNGMPIKNCGMVGNDYICVNYPKYSVFCPRVCYYNDFERIKSSFANITNGINNLATAPQGVQPDNSIKTTGQTSCTRSGFTGTFTYECSNTGEITQAPDGAFNSTCECLVPNPSITQYVNETAVNQTSGTSTATLACKSGYSGTGIRYTCTGSGFGLVSQNCTQISCNIPASYNVNESSISYNNSANTNVENERNCSRSDRDGDDDENRRNCSESDDNDINDDHSENCRVGGFRDEFNREGSGTNSSQILTCKAGYFGNPTATCTGTENPGNLSVSGSCQPITCNTPTGASVSTVNYNTSAQNLSCATGYTGSINYTCTGDTNPGSFNLISGGCELITCSMNAGTGYTAKTNLPYGPGSFSCDIYGYRGTIDYYCSTSGGVISPSSGSCEGYCENNNVSQGKLNFYYMGDHRYYCGACCGPNNYRYKTGFGTYCSSIDAGCDR